MKIQFVFVAILPSLASGFSLVTGNSPRAFSTALDSCKVYFGTTTGNTEKAAEYIAEAAGTTIEDIGDATTEEVLAYDSLIVGAPTWNTGADEQRSGTTWDEFLFQVLPDLNMEGKKVAVFGMGDQESYNDNYVDAAGELYDLFEAKGCKMFGFTSTEGYVHSMSKADRDGQFVGLMLDNDNQYELSEERSKAWVEQLKAEGFF